MAIATFNFPINPVSFGQTSIALLRAAYKQNLNLNVLPISQVDISAQTLDSGFNEWLQNSINKAMIEHNKNTPVTRLWHILQSLEFPVTNSKKCLFSFHETSRISNYEQNILNLYDQLFVSSPYTKAVWEAGGVNTPITVVPLAFDNHNFKKLDKKYYNDDRIVWGLQGKAEARKSTYRLLKIWAAKYGNKKEHILHAHINNGFVNQMTGNPQAEQQLISQALEGKHYWNIVFLPYVKTNAEVNDIANSIDIDLSGLSFLEGWGIPYFTSLCLGKTGIALNAHVNKLYCNSENSVLVEPCGMQPAEDGLFFIKGAAQNVGEWFNWKDDDVISAMETAEKRAKTLNLAGEKLKEIFSWEKSLNIILEHIDT